MYGITKEIDGAFSMIICYWDWLYSGRSNIIKYYIKYFDKEKQSKINEYDKKYEQHKQSTINEYDNKIKLLYDSLAGG
jgi:hypothetical protein